MIVTLTEKQAETIREALNNQTSGFDMRFFYSIYQDRDVAEDEMQQYEELFKLFGGEEELQQIHDAM